MANPRTILAHTDRALLQRLVRVLAAAYEIVVVRQDIAALADDVRAHRPDVIVQSLSDVALEHIDNLRQIAPDLCVVLVTHTGDESIVANAFERGVSAVILQSASDDEILDAIDAACAGHE